MAIGNSGSSGSVFTNNTIDMSKPDGNIYGIQTQDATVESNTISLYSWDCFFYCNGSSFAISADRSVISENVLDAHFTQCCSGAEYAIDSHGNEDITSVISNNTIHSRNNPYASGIRASPQRFMTMLLTLKEWRFLLLATVL